MPFPILLVEDEETLREIIREALEASGYAVLEASSGADAMGISDQHQGSIHLIITDTVIPGLGAVSWRPLLKRFELSWTLPRIRAARHRRTV